MNGFQIGCLVAAALYSLWKFRGSFSTVLGWLRGSKASTDVTVERVQLYVQLRDACKGSEPALAKLEELFAYLREGAK
jgi:hypothetical protein